MAVTTITEEARPVKVPALLPDLLSPAAATLLVYSSYAAAGFPTLSNPAGDNDSLLRLVEVRDLLGGQGWFDLTQYRMGPDGGFLMHWSRLVDAPIAGLILLASALGAGHALAESIALSVWPLLLMWATLAGLVVLGRSLGGASAVFPAVALGAGALYFVGIYQPGSIDHHNAQIALTVWMVVFLARAAERRLFPAYAGVCAALMLAIGMEAAPYVAVAGLCVAAAWLIRGADESRRAAMFGASFAATAAAAFLLTVGPRDWGVPACDAMSIMQLALAVSAGFGLAAATTLPAAGATFSRRAGALILVGIAILATALVFPQCLADPYAALDPRLREMWLNGVTEAQSVFQLAARDWTLVLVYFATPAIALAILCLACVRQGLTRPRAIYGAFLSIAFLVGCWQLRGSSFAIPLASAGLAAGIGALRRRLTARPASPLGTAALVTAWLLSFNIVWSIGAGFIRAQASQGGGSPSADACSADASFDHLARLPRGTVLAVSDLGSPILANTAHRALSGPYHRNIAGNLAMIDAMLGDAAAAETIVRTHRVDYVAVCAGNPETRRFAARAPDGLMAALANGRPPAWLALDPATKGEPIEIYRVVDEGAR